MWIKLISSLPHLGALGAQTIKNLTALRETQLRYLGWDDPLEKGMETHSSILAWRIPGTEEPGGGMSDFIFTCSMVD